ncbi:MAG: hypothetical protein IAE91_04845 [Ignavibacteriaceae bacterium]|nr:hypothetical protein [Ignavibacteriaceae bacterium]
MVKILLFVLLIYTVVLPQDADLLYMYNGEKAVIFLTKAPAVDEYVLVSRRSAGGEFVKLNSDNPVKSISEFTDAMNILANDYKQLSRILDADSEIEVIRRVKGNSFKSALLSLMFLSAAEVAGRVYYDLEVSEGNSYEYKIEYFGRTGSSTSQFTKTVNASVVKPSKPVNLKAKSVKGIVTLSWDYPKWAEDRNNLAVRFNIYRKENSGEFRVVNNGFNLRDDDSENIFTDIKPDSRSVYEYYITAVDPSGRESGSSEIVRVESDQKMPPSAPSGLTAAGSDYFIFLSWNVASESNITGYNIYRKESLGSDSLKLNSKLIEYSKPVFTDSTASYGKRYFYFVTSVSSENLESILSQVASVYLEDLIAPEPVVIKTGSVENRFVRLEIEKSKSDDAYLYKIFRGERRDVLAAAGVTSSTIFIDSGYGGTGLPAGRKIYYSVSVLDRAENESTVSPIFEIIVPDNEAPAPPSPVSATFKQGRGVEIITGSSSSGDVKEIKIFRQRENETPALLTTVTKFPAVYIDNTVKLLESYIYLVQAIDTAGNKSDFSATEPVKILDKTPPSQVRYVTASLEDNSVKITWVRVGDNDLAGYNLYRSEIPNGVYVKLNSNLVTETSYTDTQGTVKNFYKVRAVDTSGNESEWSKYANVTGGI